jgi:type IV pilus assembly protein PilC
MVIPRISQILVESGQDIPVYTKVVIALSDVLVNYGLFVLIGLVVAIFGFIRFVKTPAGKMTFDGVKLEIPYLGNLYSKLYLSRIADNLNTMLASGIPMLKALELTRDVVDNRVFLAAIDQSIVDVKGGAPVSSAFEKHEQFPNILIQMMKVGEETGNLGEILATLAKFYQREVTTAVDTLVDMIEPVMIIMLAVGVGTLLASVLIPIYNISSTF